MSRTGDNIFKRKDGRWEGRYIKSRENGRAKYGYVYSKTYKEAKAKLQSAIWNNEQQYNNDQIHYNYWLDYWLKLSKLRVKESTYVKYNNDIRNHIEPELGNLAMNEITTVRVESFISAKLKVLSSKSVSELLRIIKDSIRLATAEGAKCPCQLNRLFIKYQAKEMRVLSSEEEKHLIALKSLQFFIFGEIHFSNSFLVFVSNSSLSLFISQTPSIAVSILKYGDLKKLSHSMIVCLSQALLGHNYKFFIASL